MAGRSDLRGTALTTEERRRSRGLFQADKIQVHGAGPGQLHGEETDCPDFPEVHRSSGGRPCHVAQVDPDFVPPRRKPEKPVVPVLEPLFPFLVPPIVNPEGDFKNIRRRVG